MDKVARLSLEKRADLFSQTAANKRMTPAVVEKDFWVSWVLKHLYQHDELTRLLMFKGGTSLSKVYQLIDRFSEDIDLILDWRTLTGEDPMAQRSRTQQEKFNGAINEQARVFIANHLLALVTDMLDGICQCEIEEDPYVINIQYPGSFPDDYLRPEVRLEIGPLAAWSPFEEKVIRCYAAEEFPEVFDNTECTVKVVRAERTFWDKATILHHEAHRPDGSVQPLRYSRHYYDLAKLANADVRQSALADKDLLASVVEFKQRFYPRGWARYDLARSGSFRLIPEGAVLAAVRADYTAMQNMIFGDAPAMDSIMETLESLQDEINK
ncbi:MAG TPA: nucleotidyl transferase AbiEii/AbiGii toxin family protein [Gammaproteobacteria bacterium]|nr:nucleotidyl transferase AbiEii/AbiGii toxin family protein [Gammaproteobacteria bacterium]